MKKHHLGLPLIIFAMLLLGASGTYAGKAIEIETGKGTLFGTLGLPVGYNSCPVMLIISGSGPTDRDGNNPIKELSKLQVPILIVQGTTDIQVLVDNAIRLSKANKTAELAIIKGVNHILKEVSGDLQQQIKSYTDSNLPVAPELVNRIVAFSKKIDKE